MKMCMFPMADGDVCGRAPADLDGPLACHLHGGEVRVVNEKTGGMKGSKAVKIHALPYSAFSALGAVYSFGSEKYADYNFRKGYAWSLSFDALMRHAFAFWNGEDNDPESGLPHMAHVMWNAATLLSFMEDHPDLDDRFRP